MTIQEKREALAHRDAENWGYRTIYDVALEGCVGYNNMTNEEINELHKDIFE